MKKLLHTLAFMFLLASSAVATVAEKPNIIFILTDDIGFGDLGYSWQESHRTNQARIYTPNIDDLAREGVILSSHYCAAPVCAPSRASIMTGKLQLGETNRCTAETEATATSGCSLVNNEFDRPIAEENTLGTMMQAAGYHTMAIGKWGIGGGGSYGDDATRTAHPIAKGFDQFYGFMDHRAGHTYYHTDQNSGSSYMGLWQGYSEAMGGDGNVHKIVNVADAPENAEGHGIYSTDLFIARAKKDIDDAVTEDPTKPFFMYLAVNTVHGTGKAEGILNNNNTLPNDHETDLHVPGRPYSEVKGLTWEQLIADTEDESTRNTWIDPRYQGSNYNQQQQRYATAMSRLDDAMLELMDYLKGKSIGEGKTLADNTIIIFTSDNGPASEYNYNVDMLGSTGPFDGHKRDIYEGGMRVPAFVWKKGGFTVKEDKMPSISTDWMATIAALGGATVPEGRTGVSLLPRWTNEGTKESSKIESNYVRTSGPVRTNFATRKGSANIGGTQWMERTGEMVRLKAGSSGSSTPPKTRLYNVVLDPHQDNDLNEATLKLTSDGEALTASGENSAYKWATDLTGISGDLYVSGAAQLYVDAAPAITALTVHGTAADSLTIEVADGVTLNGLTLQTEGDVQIRLASSVTGLTCEAPVTYLGATETLASSTTAETTYRRGTSAATLALNGGTVTLDGTSLETFNIATTTESAPTTVYVANNAEVVYANCLALDQSDYIVCNDSSLAAPGVKQSSSEVAVASAFALAEDETTESGSLTLEGGSHLALGDEGLTAPLSVTGDAELRATATKLPITSTINLAGGSLTINTTAEGGTTTVDLSGATLTGSGRLIAGEGVTLQVPTDDTLTIQADTTSTTSYIRLDGTVVWSEGSTLAIESGLFDMSNLTLDAANLPLITLAADAILCLTAEQQTLLAEKITNNGGTLGYLSTNDPAKWVWVGPAGTAEDPADWAITSNWEWRDSEDVKTASQPDSGYPHDKNHNANYEYLPIEITGTKDAPIYVNSSSAMEGWNFRITLSNATVTLANLAKIQNTTYLRMTNQSTLKVTTNASNQFYWGECNVGDGCCFKLESNKSGFNGAYKFYLNLNKTGTFNLEQWTVNDGSDDSLTCALDLHTPTTRTIVKERVLGTWTGETNNLDFDTVTVTGGVGTDNDSLTTESDLTGLAVGTWNYAKESNRYVLYYVDYDPDAVSLSFEGTIAVPVPETTDVNFLSTSDKATGTINLSSILEYVSIDNEGQKNTNVSGDFIVAGTIGGDATIFTPNKQFNTNYANEKWTATFKATQAIEDLLGMSLHVVLFTSEGGVQQSPTRDFEVTVQIGTTDDDGNFTARTTGTATGTIACASTGTQVDIDFNSKAFLQKDDIVKIALKRTSNNNTYAGLKQISFSYPVLGEPQSGLQNWSELVGEQNDVALTVAGAAGISIDADATSVSSLTVSGANDTDSLTFIGSPLTVTTTTINADTDVSHITANLGAVTVAAGKTLTVGAHTTWSSMDLSAGGIIKIAEGQTVTLTSDISGAISGSGTLKIANSLTLTASLADFMGTIEIDEGVELSLTLAQTSAGFSFAGMGTVKVALTLDEQDVSQTVNAGSCTVIFVDATTNDTLTSANGVYTPSSTLPTPLVEMTFSNGNDLFANTGTATLTAADSSVVYTQVKTLDINNMYHTAVGRDNSTTTGKKFTLSNVKLQGSTISFWATTTSNNNWKDCFGITYAGSSTLGWRTDANKDVHVYSNDGTSCGVTLTGSSTVLHHYALVTVGSEMTFYVDGVKTGTYTLPDTVNADTLLNNFTLGGVNSQRGGQHKLDDVRIYDQALRLAQVQALYQALKTVGAGETATVNAGGEAGVTVAEGGTLQIVLDATALQTGYTLADGLINNGTVVYGTLDADGNFVVADGYVDADGNFIPPAYQPLVQFDFATTDAKFANTGCNQAIAAGTANQANYTWVSKDTTDEGTKNLDSRGNRRNVITKEQNNNTVGVTLNMPLQGSTVSFWATPASAQWRDSFGLDYSLDGSSTRWLVWERDNASIVHLYDGSGTGTDTTYGATLKEEISETTLYHWVVVTDETYQYYYVDGRCVASRELTGLTEESILKAIGFGKSPARSNYSGACAIADIRVYGKALDDNQVATLYQGGNLYYAKVSGEKAFTALDWEGDLTAPGAQDWVELVAQDDAVIALTDAVAVTNLTLSTELPGSFTFTGASLTATQTQILTDTDVSEIVANLGNLTIPAGVTLYYDGTQTTWNSLSGEGTLVDVADVTGRTPLVHLTFDDPENLFENTGSLTTFAENGTHTATYEQVTCTDDAGVEHVALNRTSNNKDDIDFNLKVPLKNSTISFWATRPAYNDEGNWKNVLGLEMKSDPEATACQFHLQSNQTQGFNTYGTGSLSNPNANNVGQSHFSGVSANMDTLYHYVLVTDETKMSLYVNKELFGTWAYPEGFLTDESLISCMVLGSFVSDRRSKSQIDDVRIYDRAFDAATVAELYTDGWAFVKTERVVASANDLDDAEKYRLSETGAIVFTNTDALACQKTFGSMLVGSGVIEQRGTGATTIQELGAAFTGTLKQTAGSLTITEMTAGETLTIEGAVYIETLTLAPNTKLHFVDDNSVLTVGTLNQGTNRSFMGWDDEAETVPTYDKAHLVVTNAVTMTEGPIEGSPIQVTWTMADTVPVTMYMANYDPSDETADDEWAFTRDNGLTIENGEITFLTSLTGKGAWYEWLFEGDCVSSGRKTVSFNNTPAEAAYISVMNGGVDTTRKAYDFTQADTTCWYDVDYSQSLEAPNWSASFFARMPSNAGGTLVSFGLSSSNEKGLMALVRGAKEDQVMLIYMHPSGTEKPFEVLADMVVPHAETDYHLYSFVRQDDDEKNSVAIYLDRTLWLEWVVDETKFPNFEVATGLQIGKICGDESDANNASETRFNATVNGALITLKNGKNAEGDDTPAAIDMLRIYDCYLTDGEVARIADEYEYRSRYGSFERTITAEELSENDEVNWNASEAWTKTLNEVSSQVAEPQEGAATLTANVPVTVKLNASADTSLEGFVLTGSDINITTNEGEQAVNYHVTVKGRSQIKANATIDCMAISLEGPVEVESGKTLTLTLSEALLTKWGTDYFETGSNFDKHLTGRLMGEGDVVFEVTDDGWTQENVDPETGVGTYTKIGWTLTIEKDALTNSWTASIEREAWAVTFDETGTAVWSPAPGTVNNGSSFLENAPINITANGDTTLVVHGPTPLMTVTGSGTVTITGPEETTDMVFPVPTIKALNIAEGVTVAMAASLIDDPNREGTELETITGDGILKVTSGTLAYATRFANAKIQIAEGATFDINGVDIPSTMTFFLDGGSTFEFPDKRWVNAPITVNESATREKPAKILCGGGGNDLAFKGAITLNGVLELVNGTYNHQYRIEGVVSGAGTLIVNDVNTANSYEGAHVKLTGTNTSFTGGIEVGPDVLMGANVASLGSGKVTLKTLTSQLKILGGTLTAEKFDLPKGWTIKGVTSGQDTTYSLRRKGFMLMIK